MKYVSFVSVIAHVVPASFLLLEKQYKFLCIRSFKCDLFLDTGKTGSFLEKFHELLQLLVFKDKENKRREK